MAPAALVTSLGVNGVNTASKGLHTNTSTNNNSKSIVSPRTVVTLISFMLFVGFVGVVSLRFGAPKSSSTDSYQGSNSAPFTRQIDMSSNVAQSAKSKVVLSNTKFDAKVLNKLLQVPQHKTNVIVSSWSITSVLSLLAQGADKNTKKQIVQGLEYGDYPVSPNDVLELGYATTTQDLMSSVASNENITLDLANRMYVSNHFELAQQLSQVAKQYYGSEPESVDFAMSDAVAKKINSWVEQKTRDRIKDLVSPSQLGELTRLVLVNAVYFKGKWEIQFDKKMTHPAPFYTTESDQAQVQMMNIPKSKFVMGNIDALSAIGCELPYQSEVMSMVLLLPQERFGLAQVEQKLLETDLATAWQSAGLRKQEIALQLPRFRVESTIDLKPVLKQLGMVDMLDMNAADLSKLASPYAVVKEQLYVSEVFQKAFIEVNEIGAEAAAATAAIVMTRAAPVRRPTVFRCDQPFLYFIRHNPTGLILFSGKVGRPQE